MVICLEQGADLHVTQLMPLPLTVSCFSKIQISFTFLVLAHPGSPGKKAIKRVCVSHPLKRIYLGRFDCVPSQVQNEPLHLFGAEVLSQITSEGPESCLA